MVAGLAAVILLSVALLGPSFCATVNRGIQHDKAALSIVNPNYTDINNYPYTAAVINNKTGELLGGGAIIAPRYVVTAAYNVDGFLNYSIRVRVGSNSPFKGGQLFIVNKIILHPSWSGNWTYDISLIKLLKPVAVKKVIAISTAPLLSSQSAVVTGFGDSNADIDTYTGTKLQMEAVQLYDYTTCNSKWYSASDDALVTGQFCGFTPGTGPCRKDYGDPVAVCVKKSCTLVGLFSGSYGCANDHFPGIYVDIGFYYDWIKKLVPSI